jgi:hypothetical protein
MEKSGGVFFFIKVQIIPQIHSESESLLKKEKALIYLKTTPHPSKRIDITLIYLDE